MNAGNSFGLAVSVPTKVSVCLLYNVCPYIQYRMRVLS